MANTNTPLEALLAELAAEINLDELDLRKREAAIEEKRAAHRYLQSRAQQQTPIPLSTSTRVRLLEDAAPPPRKLTFAEAVANAVQEMSGQDIFVAPVYDAIRKMNVEMPEEVRDARTRIGTQLNRLEDKGVLKKTFQGGGNVPNRYRLKEDASDLV